MGKEMQKFFFPPSSVCTLANEAIANELYKFFLSPVHGVKGKKNVSKDMKQNLAKRKKIKLN